MASPLYLEIGLHYYCCADEFDPHRMNAPAVQDALAAFVSHGMLKKLGEPTTHGATYESTEGLEVWCRALCEVNWPTRQWVMAPTTKTVGD